MRGNSMRTAVSLARHLVCSLGVLFLLIADAAAVEHPTPQTPVRIGVTAVFLDHQTAFLDDWREYLETRLQRPVVFKQRSTYREIMEMLLEEELDYAWICGYPFVLFRQRLRLLAVPIYQGEPLYQSYLIVPETDTDTGSILGLRDKVFAYSDPDSNSGYLVPQFQLHALGEDRNNFFRRSFFTWAHQKVVEAVARGLADGGAVDGYVWDTLAKVNPELTSRTRVVMKSKKFGFPPFVARHGVDNSEFRKMKNVLTSMPNDTTGRALLQRLNLDGFGQGNDQLFDGIAELVEAVPGG
jgi:phosphonate transport system substrate-binding protein